MKIRVGGEWRDIIGAKIRKSGSWRTIKAVQIYSGGSWRAAGTFSPTSTSGGMSITFKGSTSKSSASSPIEIEITAVPSNGSRPYTYDWAVDSESGPGTVSIVDPTIAKIEANATFVSAGTITATLSCTATDSVGNTAEGTIDLTYTRTA